ncbi:UDP-glycosyltransferase UGT5 [Anthophora quadrimaculata]
MKSIVLCPLTIFLLLLITKNPVNCGKILMVALAPLYSHQLPFRTLAQTLANRGHEVVLVSALTTKNSSLINYREIDFSVAYKVLERKELLEFYLNYTTLTKYEVFKIISYLGTIVTKYFYTHPEIKKIYTSGSKEKFDLVIVEGVISCAAFAIAHMLNVPFIGLISMNLHMYHNYLLGAPILPSHISNWELSDYVDTDMSFWKRLQAYVVASLAVFQWYNYETGEQEKYIRNLIGKDLPPFYDIAKNMSLLLVNHNPLFEDARPLPPNVIQFTSFHIAENLSPLPTELDEFFGNASNGFIYMSLGNTMKSSIVLSKVVKEIYNAFSRLPYKVLWKYDEDDIPKGNGNILISKWTPQESVLAHPNIKLFIYQGGMQSTEETVYYGVPTLGVPIMFEQIYRIRKLVSLGVCKMVDISKINEEMFYEAVLDVISNKSYKEKMTELSRLMKDVPYDSKENVVWWVEYVMRNKGAPHLRFSGADDPWYQRYDMDIIVFFSIVLFIVTTICVIAFVQISRWLYKHLLLLLCVSKYFPLLREKDKIV